VDSDGHHFGQQSKAYQNIAAGGTYTASENLVRSEKKKKKSEIQCSKFESLKYEFLSLKS